MALFKKGLIEEKKTRFQIEPTPEIPTLPEIENEKDLDVKYPLISPYAYAHIFYDSKENELIYAVEEPSLTDEEKKTLKILEEGISELVNISTINLKTTETIIEYLEKNVGILLDELGIKISDETFLKLMYYLYRDFVGLNEIEPLLKDYFIEDIECNGVKTPVYIVHRKYRNLKTNIIYNELNELTSFVEKLAQKSGKYISYANPLLDAQLPDGSRVNATFTQEISAHGPSFTIRKFTKEPWTPIKLIDLKTVSPELLAFLWILIENESNIMVIGGTGAGKTSFLNGIAFFIPPASRIVSIEDTREINLLHDNWLPSVARESTSIEQKGEIDLFTLLRESFRQRPDYVIVGEVRGKEAFVLFQGMSSGHPSFGTMHAEDVETMIRRLESPPIELSPSLVASLDAVCVIVQTKVMDKEVRRLKEVVEIVEVEKDKITLNKPFVWDPRNDMFYFKTDSKIFDKISMHRGISKEVLEKEFRLRSQLLLKMYRNKIFGFKEVNDIIAEYYKKPLEVLKRFNIQ